MNQQTRRQFFKTLAATAIVAVVASVVVRSGEKPVRVLMYKGVPFVYQPDFGYVGQWDNYYVDCLDMNPKDKAKLLMELDMAVKELKMRPPIRK